jgi:large subunit ribosomal protein L13
MDVFINADSCIAGRLSSIVSKELLKGNNVHVVNAEKAVISGSPEHTLEKIKEKIARGDPYHGPFYPRSPERILKRMVRGMLPYKKPMGMQAFKGLRVYISVPEELEGREFKKIENIINKNQKNTTLGDLAVKIGAKKVW